MVCFPRKPGDPRIARGAHDPLQASVLVLDDGTQKAAVVCCDLCGIRRVDIDRIRSRVAGAVRALGDGRVLIACSHSHSSVESLYLFGNTPEDTFIREMDERIAGAVIAADADLEPVEFAFGAAPVELTHNRRVLGDDMRATMTSEFQAGVTTGIVDPELAVLKVQTPDNRVKAVLFRYTAHSLTLGPENELFTADYPGRARREIETLSAGAMALFMNGAAGNVHPRECMRPDFTAMERIGQALGEAVVAVADRAAPLAKPRLGFARDNLTFTNRVDPDLQVDVELACLTLGPVVFGFVPGEVFVEFQLAFRRQLAPAHGVFVGYANGWPGYIPTRTAYDEGGYGVDLCTTDPPEYSRTALPPGAGEALTERLVELARQCAPDSPTGAPRESPQ
jgi:hypothetical protein